MPSTPPITPSIDGNHPRFVCDSSQKRSTLSKEWATTHGLSPSSGFRVVVSDSPVGSFSALTWFDVVCLPCDVDAILGLDWLSERDLFLSRTAAVLHVGVPLSMAITVLTLV